jgi:hypothetical protein
MTNCSRGRQIHRDAHAAPQASFLLSPSVSITTSTITHCNGRITSQVWTLCYRVGMNRHDNLEAVQEVAGLRHECLGLVVVCGDGSAEPIPRPRASVE